MRSRIYNVRLDEGHARKVRKLRAAGRTLTDVVRDAIDAQHDALSRPNVADPAPVVAGILERFPDPANLPMRDYDVHDRRASHQAIRRGLGRRVK